MSYFPGPLTFALLVATATGVIFHPIIATVQTIAAIDAELAIQLVPWVLSLVGGGVAIWKHRQKKTAEKVRDTLVLAIEHATTLPRTRETEKIIKGAIRARAVVDGVQPLLNPIVEHLTSGAPDDDEATKRRDIERYVASLPAQPDDSGADRP